MVAPAAWRSAVAYIHAKHGVSERRPQPLARAGGGTPALRLQAAGPAAGQGGDCHEPQEAAAAVSRGAADRAQARRPETGPGNQGAHGAANQSWPLDFVSDALADGRRFRILTAVDAFTREFLCLVADTSLSGQRVAAGLRFQQRDEIYQRGHPRLGAGVRHAMALHRPRQTPAERLHRVIQWSSERRMHQ